MTYDNEFLNLFSQSEEDQRLQMLAEAEAKVAANTAQMKSIPTRIQSVLKDPKTKQTQIVDQDVPQEVRKLAAKEQRGKMIENADLTANIQRAKEIPPNYDKTTIALYKLGVSGEDINKLYQTAEQGGVQRIVQDLGRVGQAIFEARGLASGGLLDERTMLAQQQIREELFGALGSVFQRAQDQARNLGKSASPFGSDFNAVPQSEAGGISLSNPSAGSSAVAKSAGNGTRAFTNIGTEGGQIQEIKPDSSFLRVIRKADGVTGYIAPDKFDPARYTQTDFGPSETRGLPGFDNPAANTPPPPPSMPSAPPVQPNIAMMLNQGITPGGFGGPLPVQMPRENTPPSAFPYASSLFDGPVLPLGLGNPIRRNPYGF